MKVLYIDGDPAETEPTRRALIRQIPGVEVATASTLEAARDRLTAPGGFDVVLSRLQLPDGSGLDLLDPIRGQGLPMTLVILTGDETRAAIDRAHQAEADDCLIVEAGNLDRLPRILNRAWQRTKLAREPSALSESEGRFRALVETSSDWIWEVDTQVVYTYVNPRVESLLGYRADEVVGKTPFDFKAPEEAERVRALLTPIAEARQAFTRLVSISRHRDGHAVVLESSGVPFFDEAGNWKGFRGIDRDITEHARAEEVLRQSKRRSRRGRKETESALLQAAIVFENTRDGVIVTDLDARILAVNRAFTEITGYSESEVLGTNPRLLHSAHHGLSFYESVWASLLRTGHWQGEIWNRRKSGEIYPEWLTISAVRDEGGEVTRYVGVFTDISRLRQSQDRLEQLTHYDPLTGLPNRLLLEARLAHALDHAEQNGGRVGVLHIDLDHFKTINEGLGHAVGDELLKAIAERLRLRVREEDTLARPGADNFVLVLERLDKPEKAAGVARDLLSLIKAPFTLSSGREVFVCASIGISLYPDDGTTASALIRNADAALNRAKELGRDTCHFYTEALTRAATARLNLESRLRRALERGELVLHYQPLVAVADRRVVGVEALARWQDPKRGLIYPAEFIPVAEESGLIAPLGDWVLVEACRQMQSWMRAGLGLNAVAVNLSTRQFLLHDVGERVRAALSASGLPGPHLELEITESTLMQPGASALETLLGLKDLGVRLAVDDFGTGYSSLAYLKRFPIDRLKIDRSFVKDIPTDPDDMEIVATIIAMGRNLHLEVLAEGVETEEQLAFLRENGCDAFQGHLVSPALAAEELERWLSKYLP